MKLTTLIRTWFTLIVLMMLNGMVSCRKKDHSPGNDLVITSFTPDVAWYGYGHTVTIYGNKFSEVLSENTITVGTVKAEILTATTTQLKVQIEQGMQSGYIHVTTNGKEAVSDHQLIINQLSWQKKLVGSAEAEAYAIYPVADGGYFVVGNTKSTGGDLRVPNKGDHDMWFAKLDSAKNIVWQNTLGGSAQDLAVAAVPAPDGGFFIAGNAASQDGDFTGGPGGTGRDIWIIKVNANGGVTWKKVLGGTKEDWTSDIVGASDGGCIMAGYTFSKDGDVKGLHGSSDMWIVKLDAGGSLVWQKPLGGTRGDAATCIGWDIDGGLLLGGSTNSTDGDVTSPPKGQTDMWIVKLDVGGNLVWQKTLGGTGIDAANSITATPEGGCAVVGTTDSQDGDITNAHGVEDIWVVKLNRVHDIAWQKNIGGSGIDVAASIAGVSDRGLVVAGHTYSNDGDMIGNHGGWDIWMAKFSVDGKITGQRILGGSDNEQLHGMTPTADNGYLLAGWAGSVNGDVTDPRAGVNMWLLKVWE